MEGRKTKEKFHYGSFTNGTAGPSPTIKYLTQSSWSHSALYVGPMADAATPEGEPHVLIEAKIDEGVMSSPPSKYQHHRTRICRPVGLSEVDCKKVAATPPKALVSATISRTSST